MRVFECSVWVLAFLCLLCDVIIRAFHGVVYLLHLYYFHVYRPCVEYWLELILGVSEEFAKSLVRESFHHFIRFVNGIFAWLVSLGDKVSKLWTHGGSRTPVIHRIAWENLRPSTLNSIVEREIGHQTEHASQTSSSQQRVAESVACR